MVKNASLIAFKDDSYLVQARETVVTGQKPGRYSFSFPGAFSFFGGELNDGEGAKEGFERELKEELPDTRLEIISHRVYNWSKDTEKVIARANKVLGGNVHSFLGFDLYSKVPSSALGNRDRTGSPMTYIDWIAQTTEDNFYSANITSEGRELKEGSRKLWIPATVLKSLVMVPTDRLAALDDLADRIESGQLRI
ncbi:MAG: NUDIX hydrolase [Nanoarchaeota archaeon]